MIGCLASCDPAIDILDPGQVDVVDRLAADGAQPAREPVPSLAGKEAFGIALVSRVRQQQWDNVVQRTDLRNASIGCPLADKLDRLDAFGKALGNGR